MKITTSGPNYIELLGMFGQFETPNSDYIIHYFSTFANNRKQGDFYQQLLEELMPMRERLELDKIEDLSTLLQRDLNDLRVAGDLIPYLKNQFEDKNHIAFFPAILGVLIPENFINKDDSNAIYPNKEKVDDSKYKYGLNWKIEYFPDSNGELTPLGKLMINVKNTDVIVIDGQHRANAFRVMAKSFESGNSKRQGIYSIFYKDIEVPEEYQADLPVTLIWFETKDSMNQIKPRMISRRLFVDVNNSAKQVNKSRTILLNDKDPSSVLTRFFYSKIAKERKFNVNQFSLLHSGFDVASELKNSTPHIFTLTSPEIINYSFDWFFFGKRDWSELDKERVGSRVKRQENDSFQLYLGNPSEFIEYGSDIDDELYKRLKSECDKEKLESLFESNVSKSYFLLFDKFEFLKSHYTACEQIHSLRNSGELSLSENEAWDHLYLGGEGLYYVFNSIEKLEGQAGNLKSGSKAISDRFKGLRAAQIGLDSKEVDEAFKSFRSFAFQVGLIMALDFHYRQNDKFETFSDSSIDFIEKLNNFTPKEWVYVLTTVRSVYIGGVDPKVWPTYLNLIIRLIQNDDEYYYQDEKKMFSPDAKILERFFIRRCKEFAKNEHRRNLKDIYYNEIEEKISEFISESIKDLEELYEPISGKDSKFKKMNLNYKSIALASLKRIVKF